MQQQITTEQRDILNTQNNIESSPNSNSSQKLIHREKIQKTPFYVVGREETGYFVTYGKYRLTDSYETPKDAEIAIQCQEWEQLLNVMGIIASELIEQNERKQMEKQSSL